MRLSSLLAASGAAGATAASCPRAETEAVASVCNTLKAEFSTGTYLPGDVGYTDENEVAWSTASWLGPGCIFAPADAKQLSFAVKELVKKNVKFAMRGGGHMPIGSSNGINSTGVLISSTNLDTLALSSDKNTVSVGSGPRWGDVYKMLDGTGVAVVGGRISAVGVPGLLLGGGVSFYSYEYGLASTNGNVQAYECVLADGSIVQVTENNEYSDLFWALQGGGNSFCLVTKFDLQTHEAPSMMFGSNSYGSWEIKDKFMDSVYNFATGGHKDPKGTIIPVVQYASGSSGPAYSSTLFYNGNDSSPALLQDFLGEILTPLNNATELFPFTLGQFSQASDSSFAKGGQSQGKRQRFHLLPIVANREAMQIVHDAYFTAAQETFADTEQAIIGLAFNPITSQLLSATNAKPGSLQGLDETPSFWVEQTYSWKNPSDDEKFEKFVRAFNANITEPLKAINALGSFYYLNEVDEGQPVFETYPAGNLARMKEIRDKYDPSRVFTDLMPGGFKVAHA